MVLIAKLCEDIKLLFLIKIVRSLFCIFEKVKNNGRH